jgi:2-dehydropantoate 2-reductase
LSELVKRSHTEGMRYVIHGAGAIGATIGGHLHRAGHEVMLIARGAHLAALRDGGLRLASPDGEETLRIPVAATPAEAAIGPGDVVILAMKTQDTAAALDDLVLAAPPEITLLCAQNGVENERLALRRFPSVLGVAVWLMTEHLEPGLVVHFAAPTPGVLDVGAIPAGPPGERAEAIAADLRGAGFASRAVEDVMRFKRTKLLANLFNAIQVIYGLGDAPEGLMAEARAEAEACFRAAGLSWATEEELSERRSLVSPPRPVGGHGHEGGSTWQSVARGTGRVETDYLNGEIVLLGRLHNVPTPVNEALQRGAVQRARPPG